MSVYVMSSPFFGTDRKNLPAIDVFPDFDDKVQ